MYSPEQEKRLDALFLEMTLWDKGSAERIQHFTKVHAYSRLIAREEGLEEGMMYTLEAAAYAHDIGIRPALLKYGSDAGPLQEKEGEAPVRELLTRLGFSKETVERCVFLIGHHHTYAAIDGIDFRILAEADLLVNLFENHRDREAVLAARENIFRTKTGIELLDRMFLSE